MTDSQTNNLVFLNRIIFVLSIAGIAMAIYVLQSFLRQSSIICLTGNGCEAVRKSSVAWPFGIPVPAVGLVGYSILAILAFLRTFTFSTHPSSLIPHHKLLINAMLGMSLFGIFFVTWFTLMEIFVIRGICMWCAISAVNMYVIFTLVVYSFKGILKQPR